MRFCLFGLALIVLLPAMAQAESRSIAVVVQKGDGKTIHVSIYSDIQEEQQQKISIAKAREILKNAKGWGSLVSVAFLVESGVSLDAYLPLLKAITDNPWLDIALLKHNRGLGENILKHYKLDEKTILNSQQTRPPAAKEPISHPR